MKISSDEENSNSLKITTLCGLPFVLWNHIIQLAAKGTSRRTLNQWKYVCTTFYRIIARSCICFQPITDILGFKKYSLPRFQEQFPHIIPTISIEIPQIIDHYNNKKPNLDVIELQYYEKLKLLTEELNDIAKEIKVTTFIAPTLSLSPKNESYLNQLFSLCPALLSISLGTIQININKNFYFPPKLKKLKFQSVWFNASCNFSTFTSLKELTLGMITGNLIIPKSLKKLKCENILATAKIDLSSALSLTKITFDKIQFTTETDTSTCISLEKLCLGEIEGKLTISENLKFFSFKSLAAERTIDLSHCHRLAKCTNLGNPEDLKGSIILPSHLQNNNNN